MEVADRFVERGVIVSTRGRIAQEDFTYSAHEHAKWQVPLVVIIDQDSAQRGRDLRRRRPRPPPRHDCRRAELRQGLGPRHFPAGRFRLRHSSDHGEVLLARSAAPSIASALTPTSRSAPPPNRWRASPIAMTPCSSRHPDGPRPRPTCLPAKPARGCDGGQGVGIREGKGDRHLMCEAPSGPFRQMVPVPFFPQGHELRSPILNPVPCRRWRRPSRLSAAMKGPSSGQRPAAAIACKSSRPARGPSPARTGEPWRALPPSA